MISFKSIWAAAAILALGMTGCQTPVATSTFGWGAWFGRPSVISTPAVQQQNPGSLAMYPVTAGVGQASQGISLAAEATGCQPCVPAANSGRRGAALAMSSAGLSGLSCDCDALCSRLDRIEQRLSTSPAPQPPQRLPVGSSTPP